MLAARSLQRNLILPHHPIKLENHVVKHDDDNEEEVDDDGDDDDDESESEDDYDDDDEDEDNEDEDDKDEEEVVYVSGRSKQIIIEKENPDVVFKPSATCAHDDDDADETGLVDRDIKIVMEQADVPRSTAAKALKAADGDLVEAIMKLVD